MEENQKKKVNVGLIVGIIFGGVFLGGIIIATITTSGTKQMIDVARERACCINYGGTCDLDNNECKDLEDKQDYFACVKGD